MKNFQILPVPGNTEDKILSSLHVRDSNKDFAIIWSDGKITFVPSIDYYFEEVEYLIKIGSMFYTFFNNLKTAP